MLGKKESWLKLTFSWAFGSLWWTRLTACNPFIRFSVPPWTSTHPDFHYTSAKSLSVPLECEDNFNWPSAWPWCTAREAHKCKHLGNILCTNWNIKWVCYQVKLRFRDQTYSIWSEYVISSGWFHCPNQCCFLSRLQIVTTCVGLHTLSVSIQTSTCRGTLRENDCTQTGSLRVNNFAFLREKFCSNRRPCNTILPIIQVTN